MELFQAPDGNMQLWRYIDLPALIDFLETGSLHFSRAAALGESLLRRILVTFQALTIAVRIELITNAR